MLNSLRMRAERDGKHISGAERLLSFAELENAALEMLQRALAHPRGQAQQISFSIDCVAQHAVQHGCLPDLYNNQVTSWQQGRSLAGQLLVAGGVSPAAVQGAIDALAVGAAPDGQSMRGAMLIDAESGERLEQNLARGVRVSRMDLTGAARQQLRNILAPVGLDNPHVIEALTLAGKVISAPQVVAELCWSDDPDYLAGYVASQTGGYQRISLLKPAKEERGGRAFFVRCADTQLDSLVAWLERQPVLFDRVGRIHPPQQWREE